MKSVITFLIIVSIFLVYLGCSNRSTNSISPSNYKIAFLLGDYGSQDIYTVKVDGTELTRLTETSGYYSKPFWSPDGKYIYYHFRAGSNNEIFRMDADGSNKINLTNHSEWDFIKDISRDGTQLVFISDRVGNRREVFIMDLTDSSLTQISNNDFHDFGTINFTPDGTQLVFSEDDEHGSDIYTINLADTSKTLITTTNHSCTEGMVSPNGLKIVYRLRHGGTSETDVWVCDIDGSNTGNVSQSFNHNYDHNWSPNSQNITYRESFSGSLSSIFTVNADGTNRVRVTDSTYNAFYPKWSPNGASILFVRLQSSEWELYTMDADGANKTAIADAGPRISDASWWPVR